jgi:hypothetical protein
MRITKSWLGKHDACDEGLEWFDQNFPRGGHRDEVLKKLEEVNRPHDYGWLLRRTLKKCPLPEGWVLPAGLWRLCLGGGTLPKGTQLPESLWYVYLGGGALPEGTVLPEGLEVLWLDGGTLPAETRIPDGCVVFK